MPDVVLFHDEYVSKINRFISVIAICLISLLFILDYTVVSAAIPYIVGDLGSSIDEGTYTITFFAIGSGIMMIAAGWLSKRFGTIKILSLSFLFFSIFSFLCVTSITILQLVIFRFFQGVSVGCIVPLAQSLFAYIYKDDHHNRVIAMSVYSTIVMVSPALGPVVGGYFCTEYSWKWSFYLNIPIGILCAIAVWISLKYINKSNTKEKCDFVSIILLLIGTVSLQLFFDKGEQWNWLSSNRERICLLIFFLCYCYLIIWSFLIKKPLLQLHLFKIKQFTLSIILTVLIYSLYIGSIIIVPMWLQDYLHYNAFWAGVVIAPLGIFSLVTPLFGHFIKKIGFFIPIAAGLFFIFISCLYSRYFTSCVDLYHIIASKFIFGVGIAIIIMPLLTMPVSALPEHLLSDGLGIFHFIRAMAGAIGASVYVTLFNRRISHQHVNIISNFNDFNINSVEYINKIKNLIINDNSLEIANRFINQQASTIAFNEINYLMACIVVIVFFISLFTLRKKAINEYPALRRK